MELATYLADGKTLRCQSLTKAGTQCRKAASESAPHSCYCAQHQTPVLYEPDVPEFSLIDPATHTDATPEREAWLLKRGTPNHRHGQLQRVERGQQLIGGPKAAGRKARKAARRMKMRNAAASQAKGARLARECAKATRRSA